MLALATVVVQRWPILDVLQEYLLNLKVFSDKHNLVNVENPFGKYKLPSEADDRELLAGRWYLMTYMPKLKTQLQSSSLFLSWTLTKLEELQLLDLTMASH